MIERTVEKFEPIDMGQEVHPSFLALDSHKRDKILNASMREFRYGYRKASTDTIVKDAGISKGLLFRYFGSKANLYRYCAGYAIGIVEGHFGFEVAKLDNHDIFESLLEAAQISFGIVKRYPDVFGFFGGLYMHGEDAPGLDVSEQYLENQKNLRRELFARCDKSLFRQGVDIDVAAGIIMAVFENICFEDCDEDEVRINRMKAQLGLLRECFYTEQA